MSGGSYACEVDTETGNLDVVIDLGEHIPEASANSTGIVFLPAGISISFTFCRPPENYSLN